VKTVTRSPHLFVSSPPPVRYALHRLWPLCGARAVSLSAGRWSAAALRDAVGWVCRDGRRLDAACGLSNRDGGALDGRMYDLEPLTSDWVDARDARGGLGACRGAWCRGMWGSPQRWLCMGMDLLCTCWGRPCV